MKISLNYLTKLGVLASVLFYFNGLFAQGYTSYFTGSTDDVEVATNGGLVLMGGATENDDAMIWFLEKANGGDVVVIRSSGSNGYNNYLYSQLGVSVNSVETLVITSQEGANNEYVVEQIMNAEALWIAGGNQWNYVNYFKDQGVGNAINYLLTEKMAVVGGTSAGMAVLGGSYFSAQNGTVSTAAALSNPYGPTMTIGHGDFLHAPWVEHVITDSHYNDPDRRGRHFTFLARMEQDLGIRAFGIASDEYTSVCIEPDGTARAFGDYPEYQEFVYFLQSNCNQLGPEVCVAGTPLTWNRDNQAVKVYKVPAANGEFYLDLNDWETGEGGSWQDWWVENGNFQVNADALPPNCLTTIVEESGFKYEVFPTVSSGEVSVWIENAPVQWHYQLLDLSGRVINRSTATGNRATVNLANVPAGMYLLQLEINGKMAVSKLVRP
jgi:cyanophycinase-like exopeptidase